MNAQPKSLFIVRHGAAAHMAPSDHERELTEQGRAKIVELGAAFAARQISFDCVIASDATRASQTCEALVALLPVIPMRRAAHEYYRSSAQTWLQAVQELPEHVEKVLLIGHNPALSELATLLHGKLIQLAPGDLCALGFARCWKELGEGSMHKLDWQN